MKLINCLLIFIVSFFAIHSNAKENFDNKAWYEERFKFFQNYKNTLKKAQKSNPAYKGAIAETVTGQAFPFIDTKSQNEVDQLALKMCVTQGGIKCKIRIRSFKNNPNYNRLAVWNKKKNTLDGSMFKLKVKKLFEHKGIVFLNNIKNFNSNNNQFTCSKTTSHQSSITNIFVKELNKFPKNFLDNSGLKFVVVCGEILRKNGGNPTGLAPSHFDQSPGVFFINSKEVKNFIANKFSFIAAHTFHHELYHIIDAKLTLVGLDEKWVSLNKYSYSNQNIIADGKVISDGKGFVSNYARNNEFEDKAELFANLLVNFRAVKEAIKNDPILFKKTELMISRLKKISPSVNQDFWKKFH